MALNIALTPKYDPYTYEDYIKPLESYWKDYAAYEEALSNLDSATSTLDYIVEAEPETSPLKASYAAYKQKLVDASNALSNGLNSTDRKLLRDLKSSFLKDINPIEVNYKKLQELIAEQRKAKQANNSIRFSRDASTISVGELMQNPNLGFESYIGDQITADAASMLAPLSKVISGISNKTLIPGYSSILENMGLTLADVQSYLQNPDNPNMQFKKVIDEALKIAVNTSGVQNWGDEEALADAYNFARQGIYAAIGGQKTQHVKNPIIPIVSDDGKNPKNETGNKNKDKNPFAGISGRSVAFNIGTPTNASQEDRSSAQQTYDYMQQIQVLPSNKLTTPQLEQNKAALRPYLQKAGGISEENIETFKQALGKAVSIVSKSKQKHQLSSSRDSDIRLAMKTYAEKLGVNGQQLGDYIVELVKSSYTDDGNLREIYLLINKIQEEEKGLSDIVKEYSYSSGSPYPDPDWLFIDYRDRYVNGKDIQKKEEPNLENILAFAKQDAQYKDAKTSRLAYQGTPLYEKESTTAILQNLGKEFENLKSTGQIKDTGTSGYLKDIQSKGGKGIYQINYNNGTLQKLNAGDTNYLINRIKEGNVNLFFDTVYGLVVSTEVGTYYFKGSNQTKVFDEIVNIGHVLSDVSYSKYNDYRKRHYNNHIINITPEQMSLQEQGELYQQLLDKNLLKKDGNVQYAYIDLNLEPLKPSVLKDPPKTTPLKIVFDNMGRYLGVSNLQEELYSKNPMSNQVVQRLINEAAFDLVSNNLNKSTSVAPNQKDNITANYY